MNSRYPNRNRRFTNTLAIAMVGALGIFAGAANGQAGDSRLALACVPTTVTVRSQDSRDGEDLCRGAIAATEFFRSLGQDTRTPIELEVVERLPSDGSPSAVGCFGRLDRRAYALTYQAFSARERWLGIPVTRELYESIAVHEVAHALTACTAASYPLSTHATEYVAFAAMFSTMPSSVRDSVFAQYPDADFANEWEITEIAYGLDAIRFGVAAYRHFQREPDPAAFLQAILDGTALMTRQHY